MAPSALASMHEVKPGSVPTLSPDEGLLVVGIDTSAAIGSVQIRRDGRIFGGDLIRDIPQGRSERLYVATAGDYRWDNISYYFNGTPIFGFDLKDDKEFHFTVKPGVINYPGDLIHRPNGASRAIIHCVNRGLGAIDWLHAKHPALYEQFRFVYNGHYVDPFPEFYRIARDAQPSRTDAELDKTLAPPDPGTLPIPVTDFWPDTRIENMQINPSGDLIAETTSDSKASHVDIVDLKAGSSTRLFDSPVAVDHVEWVGNHVLAVSYANPLEPPTVIVSRIGDSGVDGHRHFVNTLVTRRGWIVGRLPDDPDHLLYENQNKDGELHVHRLAIGSAEAILHSDFSYLERLDHGVNGAVSWFTDGGGRLRAAIAKQGDDWAVFYGADGRYAPVFKLSDFDPLAMSADGYLFYGLSDKERGQKDLVAFDPATHAFKTIYSKPGVDIEAPVLDAHRSVIGAAYVRNGVRVIDYFDENDRNIAGRVAEAFPGSTTMLVDRDDAGRHFIVAVESSDQPVRYFLLELDHATAALIDEAAPALAERKLAPARVVDVTANDGTRIEAYLTLPQGRTGKLPMIVYAHGGPIGVRDSLDFDPSVQLFASMGYAVLQVNFRGSEGYGRAFREAGERHFGNLIEDDIDAATRVALKDFPIDPDRLCAVGASYGGYSALVSVIRWPQRFRCAVSIAGVSDQQLMFTASDASQTVAGRTEMEKIVGNPVADGESMRTYSPLYRYKEITVPVMLAHGTEDVRVDYENSRRLVRMLNMAGREPVMLTLRGEGHGNFDNDNLIALWTGVAGFLRAHLDGDAKVTVPAH